MESELQNLKPAEQELPLEPPKKRRWFLLKVALVLTLVGCLVLCSAFIYFFFNTPRVEALRNYDPPRVTEVFANDDSKIGEFFKQRRLLVQLEEIPHLLVQAFVASEDDSFFQHSGIDFKGIARAMLKNMLAGEVKQGGSTITQQVAKSLLLSSERTLNRKIKEAILAYRMENNLSKEEILTLYLNQIYLGHGAYGVKAAAENYFAKELFDLNLAEMAILAGLPQAPSRYSPVTHADRAKQRQIYVLKQMSKSGMITEQQEEQARNMTVTITGKKDHSLEIAPYFTEHVRKYLVGKYGNDSILYGGMHVFTTLDSKRQLAAQHALRNGLRQVDKRQGYRGPIKTLTDETAEEFIKRSFELWGEALPIAGDNYEALVNQVNDKQLLSLVRFGPYQGVLPLAAMSWARKPNTEVIAESAKLEKPSSALKKNDLILIRLVNADEIDKELTKKIKKEYPEHFIVTLEQEPQVQGALASIDPVSGELLALVGGYDYQASQFNRAVQARRQPGSAFKPIIFSAALDRGYTASSMIVDSPVVFDDPAGGEKWKPKNYGGKFKGETIFRDALIKSRNIPTVKIVEDIGISYLINYAKKLGFTSEFEKDYSIALGSCVASPLEMAAIFSVFANGGKRIAPYFIRRVVDRFGNILESNGVDYPDLLPTEELLSLKRNFNNQQQALTKMRDKIAAEPKPEGEAEQALTQNELLELGHPDRVLKRETAYIMTHLLKEVVSFGTGYRVKALNRPAAGKTGTTNENVDAWFVGYTPDLLAAVWVGFDDTAKSLGRGETGGKAASPIWLAYMQEALKELTTIADFEVPKKVVFARIDRQSGKLANEKTENTVFEAFTEGSIPQETAGEGQEADREKFFMQN